MAEAHTSKNALPEGYALGAYTVEGVLYETPSCVVYPARENKSGRRVVIYECFPQDLAVRNEKGAVKPSGTKAAYNAFADAFRQRAKMLAEVEHAGVEKVQKVFRGNTGAIYAVVAHVEGTPLDEWVRGHGMPDAETLHGISLGLLFAMERLHGKGLVHGGVDARTILVKEDGTAVLTGCCAHVDTPGGAQGDVRALGAVWYGILTGNGVPAAGDASGAGAPRLGADAALVERYGALLLAGIDKALCTPAESGWMSAEEWCLSLCTGAVPEGFSAPVPEAPAVEVPVEEEPATEAPAEEAPTVEATAPEAPAVEIPEPLETPPPLPQAEPEGGWGSAKIIFIIGGALVIFILGVFFGQALSGIKRNAPKVHYQYSRVVETPDGTTYHYYTEGPGGATIQTMDAAEMPQGLQYADDIRHRPATRRDRKH